MMMRSCGCHSVYELQGLYDGTDCVSDLVEKQLYSRVDEMNNYFIENGNDAKFPIEINEKKVYVNDHFTIRNLNITFIFVFTKGDDHSWCNVNLFKEIFDRILKRKKYDVDITCYVHGKHTETMINRAVYEFEHELLHAYQQNELMHKGMSLRQMNQLYNYNKKSIDNPNDEQITRAIKGFLYATDVFERGANVAQLYRELKLTKKEYKDSMSLMNAIRKTASYKIYETLMGTVLEIKRLYSLYEPFCEYNMCRRDYLRKEANEMLEKCKDAFNEVSERKVKTVDEFVNRMIYIFSRYSKKYVNNYMKIAEKIKHQCDGNDDLRFEKLSII